MRSRSVSALALLGLIPVAPAHADGGPMAPDHALVAERSRRELNLFRDNFRLVDSTGRAWSLGAERDHKRIVLVAWNPSCPKPESVLAWANARVRASGRTDADVQLLFLDPARPQDRGAVERIRPGITAFPVLMDHSQTVSRSFGFARSGDFLVLDPESWKVAASGPAYSASLDDALRDPAAPPPGLAQKLRALAERTLRGLRHAKPECELGYAEEGQALDAGVAKALYRVCLGCHLQNEGSNVFHSYADLKSWHEMNRTVMRLFRMPSGGVDYEHAECGRAWGDPATAAQDLSLVSNWIEHGEPPAKEGDPVADEIRREARPALDMGKPFLSWQSPGVDHVPAAGWLSYVYRQIGPFKQDTYLHAARLRFNGLVTHHVAVYSSPRPLPPEALRSIDPKRASPEESRLDREMPAGPTRGSWLKTWEWANQSGVREAWPGTVFKVAKGDYLIVEQHFESDGREETNRTRLELFAEPHPEGKLVTRKIELPRSRFTIPPGANDFELVKAFAVKEDTSLLSAFVHGHYRLSRYFFKLILPDGHERRVCNVAYAQVSAPASLVFRNAVFAPAGSKIEFHIFYDNSAGNPLNPDPGATVTNGSTFGDEMDLAQLTVVPGRMPGSR